MPTATSTDRAPAPTTTVPAVSTSTASSGGTSSASNAAAPQTVSTTGAAVQAALTTAEMLSSSNSAKAVNLQFSVGDADLSLRVQLLNGQVHATFSTDSPQLRGALASEWQSMSSSSTANTHLAEPVFTASGGGSFLAGDGASRQGSQQSAQDFASSLSGSTLPPSRSTSTALPPAAATNTPVGVASSQHLQTFA